jgi:hypothetical protein
MSLPDQIALCPSRADAVHLSANDHGARFVECDYIVALDKISDRVLPFGVPVVTRHLYGDYRILQAPVADSGIAAAWVARLMGCGPIWVAGMDLLGGYWHDATAESNRNLLELEDHLRRWRFLTSKHPADYRPVGGPLVKHGVSGTPDCFASRELLEREISGVVVEFTAPLPQPFQGRDFERGEVVELKPGEAQHFVKNNRARICRNATA